MSEEKEFDTSKMSFHEKFLAVISELKAPKNQYNKFGKYNYRSAEDILEGVKPIAFKYGLIPNLSDEIKQIGDRYYVEATSSITDGEKIMKSTGLAREEENKKGMDGAQITGTASSYARKYAMNGLYQIDDTKDADTNEFKNQQEKNGSAKPNDAKQDNTASEKQVGMLKSKVIEYSKVRGGNKSQLEEFLMNTFTVKDIYSTDKQKTSAMIKFLVDKLEQG